MLKDDRLGTSLASQWLRLCDSTTRGTDSIPGQGTKILHATKSGQNKKINTIMFIKKKNDDGLAHAYREN